MRTYANPSVALRGLVAARTLDGDFDALAERILFAGLGLRSTFLELPAAVADDDAQGYSRDDVPIRLSPGVFATETYGIRTNARDLLRSVEANLGMLDLEPMLQRAIADRHIGYYRVGPMIQELIWEQYPYPVSAADLAARNAPEMLYEPHKASAIDPPVPPESSRSCSSAGSSGSPSGNCGESVPLAEITPNTTGSGTGGADITVGTGKVA
jgi:beta-lactamase class C